MTYYFTKSKGHAADMAAKLADGKHAFRLWTTGGACRDYDRAGKQTGISDADMHADAVEVWPAMSEKELKNARRIAATRETLRGYEDAADAILEKAPEDMTRAERARLLEYLKIAYHDSGKIEDCASIDGCATCDFCQKMIAAAEKNPLMICGCCYADADNKYKEASRRRHTLNARILSTVLFTRAELSHIVIPSNLCRINEDGDTVNRTHAQNILRIAATHADVHFGYWYKNAAAVEAGLHAEGIHDRDHLPNNVRFVHSSALIGIPARELWFDDFIFTVHATREDVTAAIASGAWECNGRKCKACGYNCYLMARRQAAPVHIAEYLRTDAATRAGIVVTLENFRTRSGRK